MKSRQSKKIFTYSILLLLGIGLLFRTPANNGELFVKWIIVINCWLVVISSLILQIYFSFHFRTIRRLLTIISTAYSNPLDFKVSPVLMIKKHLYDKQRVTFLDSVDETGSARREFVIVHRSQRYEFISSLPSKYRDDLMSVVLYYFTKDVPYELLYEEVKYIHKHFV